MSRITACFEKLKKSGRKVLIPYVTAGDPTPAVTLPLMHEMVRAGADIIELGVPFSDPMADGPVIQAASERALSYQISLRDVMDMVQRFRLTDKATPVILMGYLNPIEVMGYDTFARSAAQAGVDGVLTVDLPPEEGHDFLAALNEQLLDPIFLIAPTSTEERIKLITDNASGFVYYVAIKGVTGASDLDVDDVAAHLEKIRKQTDLPIGVGFGIKDADSAERVAQVADAVVVGSAIVKRVAEHIDAPEKINDAVTGLLGVLRHAIDTAED